MTVSRGPDFEAEITVLPPDPTTRLPPAYNGIRWGFAFAEDVSARVSTVADIWPVFLDRQGGPLASDIPLQGTLKAFMHMVTMNWDHAYASRIRVGAGFMMMEGARVVATGVVTAVFPRNEMG